MGMATCEMWGNRSRAWVAAATISAGGVTLWMMRDQSSSQLCRFRPRPRGQGRCRRSCCRAAWCDALMLAKARVIDCVQRL